MIGSASKLGRLADRAHRLVAVHLRHHDVHQDDVDVRVPLRAASSPRGRSRRRRPPCRAPRARWSARRCCARRRRRSAPSCPSKTASALWSCSSIRRFSSGSCASTRCRNSAVSSSSRSGERDVLDDDRLGVACLQPRLLAARELLAGVDDHRQVAEALVVLAPARAARSRSSSGSFRSSTMQSKCCSLERLERLLARADRRRSRRRRRRRSARRCALRSRLVVLDHEQAADARAR